MAGEGGGGQRMQRGGEFGYAFVGWREESEFEVSKCKEEGDWFQVLRSWVQLCCKWVVVEIEYSYVGLGEGEGRK